MSTVSVFDRKGNERVFVGVNNCFPNDGVLSIIVGSIMYGIPIRLIKEYREVRTP